MTLKRSIFLSWRSVVLLASILLCTHFALGKNTSKSFPLGRDEVNSADFAETGKSRAAVLLKAQVLLDRNRLSPGVIDGKEGANFRKALSAFQHSSDLKPTGRLDQESWARLSASSSDPVLIDYTVSEDDVKGPFTPNIPHHLEEMADLKSLSYASPLQLLAEKFHMEQGLLKTLNPRVSFDAAGATILVANIAQETIEGKAEKVEVDKTSKDVRLLAANGKLIAFYPASIGSKDRPAPSGTLKVRSIKENPTYHYSPRLRFKQVKANRPFDIAPGPNNPVGLVWIDLGNGYGIHGTPDPSNVGKSFSHGCIRLTNWDAVQLAKLIKPGTQVEFRE